MLMNRSSVPIPTNVTLAKGSAWYQNFVRIFWVGLMFYRRGGVFSLHNHTRKDRHRKLIVSPLRESGPKPPPP
jgi:hypothetical protein